MPPPENRVRDEIIGPDSGPEPPFPIRLSGPVIKGFGRGSRELGIPTANIPISGLSVGGNSDLASGVYFGWVGLDLSRAHASSENAPAQDGTTAVDGEKLPSGASTPSKPTVNPTISRAQSAAQLALSTPRSTTPTGLVLPPKDTYPAVLSIGYNPFYNNTHRSVEIHIMHTFEQDFYNARLNLSILGFIRPEYDYESLDKLVEDIKTDIEVAGRSLAREKWGVERGEKWLVDFEVGEEDKEEK